MLQVLFLTKAYKARTRHNGPLAKPSESLFKPRKLRYLQELLCRYATLVNQALALIS